MANIPDIKKGLGRFTPALWKRLWEAVCFIEEIRASLISLLKSWNQQKPTFTSFPAILTGYTEYSTNRWRYGWVKAVWDDAAERFRPINGTAEEDPEYELPAHPLGSADAQYAAWNGLENANDGFLIESGGVNYDGEDYPGVAEGDRTFYLQPIQGDWQPDATWDGEPATTKDWDPYRGPVVMMHIHRSESGREVYWFAQMNQHDGKCPVQPP